MDYPSSSAPPVFIQPLAFGLSAAGLILLVYFVIVGLISGLDFAVGQFLQFWYFLLALAIGFAVQVGLYTYLRQVVARHHASGGMVVASGATSTLAMVSCCAHYLVNLAPLLGVAGFLTVVAQYQIELFWAGLAFNAAGIAFILSRVFRARKVSAI